MPCVKPIKAYRLIGEKTENGKSVIVFKKPKNKNYENVYYPCGGCKDCRLNKAKEWGIRCYHESLQFDSNCFITLTYSDQCLPENNSLNKIDFENFMKKLRRKYKGFMAVSYKNKVRFPIRYFHCGEYGDKNGRPHHHACLFNFDFEDKKFYKEVNGNKLYISESLDKLWSKEIKEFDIPYYDRKDVYYYRRKYYVKLGYCLIGDVTFQSACYIARYIMKKINGKMAEHYYRRVNELTGEVYMLTQEYVSMSTMPGLGQTWFNKFKDDAYNFDHVVINGKKYKVPKYYDKMMEKENPFLLEDLKIKRKLKSYKKKDDNTLKRLMTKYKVLISKITQLERKV